MGGLGLEGRLLMASSLSLSLSIHECLIEQSLNRSTVLFAKKNHHIGIFTKCLFHLGVFGAALAGWDEFGGWSLTRK